MSDRKTTGGFTINPAYPQLPGDLLMIHVPTLDTFVPTWREVFEGLSRPIITFFGSKR